jgi:hypothetical protein
MGRACQASLSRLGTNFLDLYLLHWPAPNSQFSDVVAGFEQLRAVGKIKAWGVSNFNADQMEDLFRITNGNRCATNQVPYSLTNRGVERNLLTWCKRYDLPVKAYSPLGGDSLLISDPHFQVLVRHMAVRRPRSRLPGPSAAVTSSPFPNPGRRRMKVSRAVSGLERPAEIIIDHWGIAHIYAASKRDMFFLQGYNSARDRLWQIDLWRKRGLGLLAKDFGADYVRKTVRRVCSSIVAI